MSLISGSVVNFSRYVVYHLGCVVDLSGRVLIFQDVLSIFWNKLYTVKLHFVTIKHVVMSFKL